MYKTVSPRFWFFLSLLLTNWCQWIVAAEDSSSPEQKAVLGRTVKALLNVQANPESRRTLPLSDKDISTSYMKKIFEKYRRDGANGTTSAYGNIVRSLKPKITGE